jgi:ketosteroid isomerase-like protein
MTPDQPNPAAAIADRVRAALGSADPAQFESLLHPEARWGAPGDPTPSCQSRDQVLAWYRQAREAGVRARVTAADVHGDKILLALRVTRAGATGAVDRWQVLTVRDGQIADIRAFDRRDDAESMATTSDVR